MRIDYGEILFVGTCNLQCFYCLGHEMHDSTKENTLNTHFLEWPNFKKWLDELHRYGTKTIYLSSTNSEPMLYIYISELIDYLQNEGFNVGIRTNASIDRPEIYDKCKEEVSLSLQSLYSTTFYKITNVSLNFDFLKTLSHIKNDKLRVTIVVNRYNYLEVFEMLEKLKEFNLKYVQLRQCYKYYETDIEPDIFAFNYIMDQLKKYTVKGNFNESIIYDYKGLPVSVWETVFKKSSISSSNYWTNGVITHNNLLVEGYENDH